MKKQTRHDVDWYDLRGFLSAHENECMRVTYSEATGHYSIFIEQEFDDKSDFYMSVLRDDMYHQDGITEEQQNAIDYAIECIKTLKDMNILKGEQDND